jgi:hypothetical protein
MAVEIDRYGSLSHYPPDALRAGRRPLLQYPVETIETTLANPRARVIGHGYQCFSALIEERFHETGPAWLRAAEVLRVVENYLRSGLRFVYLHTVMTEDLLGSSLPVHANRG